MKLSFSTYLPVLFVLFLGNCNFNPKSEVDLELIALEGLITDTPRILFIEDIDMDKTPDCGRATVDNSTGQQPGTGGQGGGTFSTRNTQGGNQQNERFSIISTFNIKPSFETLNMRFTYDKRQFKGPLNPQQGFTLTGGLFGSTVTGRQGTVEWGQNGINLIGNQSNQQLNFMQVKLDLTGTYVPGAGSTIPPNQCNTQDGVNCTSTQTNTQCFTQDNRTCIGDSAASENAVQILIRGTITCNAPGII
ncbi:MAG: hypothetical protein JJT78_18580 [Leptospira sp.]|nr:hypothetical protein [Leptospira sp.]